MHMLECFSKYWVNRAQHVCWLCLCHQHISMYWMLSPTMYHLHAGEFFSSVFPADFLLLPCINLSNNNKGFLFSCSNQYAGPCIQPINDNRAPQTAFVWIKPLQSGPCLTFYLFLPLSFLITWAMGKLDVIQQTCINTRAFQTLELCNLAPQKNDYSLFCSLIQSLFPLAPLSDPALLPAIVELS